MVIKEKYTEKIKKDEKKDEAIMSEVVDKKIIEEVKLPERKTSSEKPKEKEKKKTKQTKAVVIHDEVIKSTSNEPLRSFDVWFNSTKSKKHWYKSMKLFAESKSAKPQMTIKEWEELFSTY